MNCYSQELQKRGLKSIFIQKRFVVSQKIGTFAPDFAKRSLNDNRKWQRNWK